MKDSSLQEMIAKAFVICLPFRMISIFTPVTSLFGMQAESLSFIFHILGLFLIFLSYRKKSSFFVPKMSNMIYYFWKMILAFAIISIIMALYIDINYGKYNGNSPYIAVLKLLFDFIQYALIMYYSKWVFLYLGQQKVIKCLIICTRISLIIGYLQIAVLSNISTAASIYHNIAAFLNLRTYARQIALTFYEPSWAAIFIGTVVIPLHMSRIINKRSSDMMLTLEVLFWIPVIIMTKSTTAYLLTFAAVGSTFIYVMFKQKKNNGVKIVAVFIFIVGIIALNNLEYIDDMLGFNFSYLFKDKLTDTTNQSTASRMIPLIGNWEIFKKFPLIGCGNGLQGYFFGELIPNDVYSSLYLDKAVYKMLSGESLTIPNGQLFIPGILSGYGIVGIVLFVRFILLSIKTIKNDFDQYGMFGEIYVIALLPIIIAGFKSEFVGMIYIWFILSIPYAAKNKDYAKK